MPSAGEVEQFAYCAHNWWLARKGVTGTGAGSDRGIARHAELGEKQQRIRRSEEEYASGLAWSFRILGLSMSLTFLGFELVFLKQNPYHVQLLTLALFMVSISAGLMTIALAAQARAKKQQEGSGLVPGQVVDSDLKGGGRTLRDREWDLTGTPDYLLETSNGPVPVEVKTGRTPPQPFPSHALQLACYLHLLEVSSGRVPEYGLLNYPEGFFRVAWDGKLKGELRATLDRMAAAEKAGKADRDHEQPGRCRGCSRREACEQRLA